MADNLDQVRNSARILLASIRLFNGVVALFAPTLLTRQFGGGATVNQAIIHVLRMFGVRTIVIGVQLLVPDEQLRADALRYAVPIHASDTLSAALVGIQGQVPGRVSIMLTAISGLNTILAVLAQPRKG